MQKNIYTLMNEVYFIDIQNTLSIIFENYSNV